MKKLIKSFKNLWEWIIIDSYIPHLIILFTIIAVLEYFEIGTYKVSANEKQRIHEKCLLIWKNTKTPEFKQCFKTKVKQRLDKIIDDAYWRTQTY